jgi:HEAT repeat protein
MVRYLCVIFTAILMTNVSSEASAQPNPKKKSAAFLHKTAAEWSTQLKSPMASARRNAAFALGKLGVYAAAALPEMCALYAVETDAGSREAIVGALGEIAAGTESVDAAVEKLLLGALKSDADRYVRRSAALALGQLGNKRETVRTALGEALADKEQIVRQNAAWALGQLDAKAVPMLISALHDATSDALVKRDAATALYAVGKQDPESMRPALSDLLALCRATNPEVRKAALVPLVEIVGRKDAAAVPVLRDLLNDSDVEVRRFAAMALCGVGGAEAKDAVPILLDALRNGEPKVKQAAALALHNLRDVAAPAVPELIQSLEGDDLDLRRFAALALGGIGKAAGKAVPPLVQIMSSAGQPPDLRIEAAEALTNMGNIPAVRDEIPAVLKVLGDPAEDGNLRVRLAWLFNAFINDDATMKAARPVMTSVCSEPIAEKNGSVRYHCAYLMAARFQREAPDSVLHVLGEWLLDDTGKLYGSKTSKAGAIGTEVKEGSTVATNLEGDSRTMAVDVLVLVGVRRVAARDDIMNQLRRLRDDEKSNKMLRKKCAHALEILTK